MNCCETELRLYLESLKKRQPTEFMMVWMKFYDNICERECCFSPDCGSIRCSVCKISLTCLPPKIRYQCIECKIPPPDVIFSQRPEICEECYFNPRFLHNHLKFLKIDSKGIHSLDLRESGYAELKKLNLEDFKQIKKKISNNDCLICCSEFSMENPAVCYPGCEKEHGAPEKTKDKEILDSFNYNHANCLMNWYQISNQDKYCGSLLLCEVCIFDEELVSWRNLFEHSKGILYENIDSDDIYSNVIQKIESNLTISIYEEEIESVIGIKEKNEKVEFLLKIIREKLNLMHPQKYIQTIINSVLI